MCISLFFLLLNLQIFPISTGAPLKDPTEEINIIKLIEDSTNPYDVFHEKQKGEFTREELETRFQTLLDMINSDGNADQTKKNAAIKSGDWKGFLCKFSFFFCRIGRNAR